MTARVWPTGFDLEVIRRFSPWLLADLAARLIALALAELAALWLARLPIGLVVLVLALVVVPVLASVAAVVWSAPAGADSMTTGPPWRAREAPYGAGRV